MSRWSRRCSGGCCRGGRGGVRVGRDGRHGGGRRRGGGGGGGCRGGQCNSECITDCVHLINVDNGRGRKIGWSPAALTMPKSTDAGINY